MSAVRGILQRAALVLLGLLLGVVALELALQGAALGRRLLGRSAETVTGAGGARLLALGDSNTYGLYCDSDEAYPSVLGELWNARPGAPRLETVNAGYPGMNTSLLLRELPALLARVRPQTVTILAGVNDAWTEPVEHAGLEDSGGGSFLWRWSRAYRLFLSLRQSIHERYDRVRSRGPVARRFATDLIVAGHRMRMGWSLRTSAPEAWLERLDANLDAIVALVRAQGAEPVLLTYASEDPVYGSLNVRLRAAAERSGTRLVDVAAAFRTRCPRGECPELLFPDRHPTPAGHRLFAETLLAGWDGWAGGAAAH